MSSLPRKPKHTRTYKKQKEAKQLIILRKKLNKMRNW